MDQGNELRIWKRTFGLSPLALVLVACSAHGPSIQPSIDPIGGSMPVGSEGPAIVTPDPTELDETPAPPPEPSPIAGCGTGEVGFFDHAHDVDRSLAFGDAEIELTTAMTGMRDGSYVADDAIPGFLGLTEGEAVVVIGPRGRAPVTGDGMAFPEVRVVLVPWSDVTFPAAGLPDDGGAGVVGLASIGADGSTSVVAPAERGEYLVELYLRWQTACLEGDGVAYGRIKVD